MARDSSNSSIAMQHFKKAEGFNEKTIKILEMIAVGAPTSEIYCAIALLYETRHPGMRCSMLELEDGKLLHGGAPSLPKEYCEQVHGLEYGPNVGSCGTATYTGKRCIVENIETDPRWEKIKHIALPHGMRCCWSEPIISSQGNVLGAFGMYYDHPGTPNEEESKDLTAAARLTSIVMERDHNHKRIEELAYVDTLTKLASRAYFHQYIERLINSSKRYGRRFSLLYIDLDGFKHINDSMGHSAGDDVLRTVSKRLKETCQDVDFIARLCGDEFALVIEGEEDTSNTICLAQRCIDAIGKPMLIQDTKHILTCSIGIAQFPNDGKNALDLLKSADTALYSAKEKGKNCYLFYELKLMEKVKYKFKFEHALREALDKEQISLLYQAKVDINSNKVVGVEALARWRHPEFDHSSPTEFIDVAERIGIIKPITEWILYKACYQAAEWKKSKAQPITIAVNISPSLFLNNDIVTLVKQVLKDTGIKPSMLELEVTENVMQTNPENISVFKELKNLGVHLAIDDFGAGYSSFASLKHIEIDTIKIDQYFIDDMLGDHHTKFLISSMIDIAHNFGYKIVAEGVETNEQLLALKELGCDIVQGHLFSKPVSEKELLAVVAQF